MLEPGQRLGRYELVRCLATGGMATVWLAQLAGAHGFEKWVAVKVIQPRFARDPHLVQMFLDEVRVVSRIRHSNVCAVLDLGVADDLPYLVMEYLNGVPFSAALRRGWRTGEVPPALVARVLADAARGLHAAHELRGEDGELLGVVHRDVSPQNIVVQHDGSVKVVDFGIAKARGKLAVTRVGELKGKISYMAPEQLLLAPVDRRTDVWSLGVLLWEATVGERLFLTDDRTETARQILRAPIRPPSDVRAGYPKALEHVALAALDREPSRRTPTAAALADGLERWLYSTGEPFGAAQVSDWLARHFDAAASPADPGTPSGTSMPAAQGGRITVSVPNVEAPPERGAALADETDEVSTHPVAGSVRPPSRRSRGLFVVLLSALAIAAVAGIWLSGTPAPMRDHVARSEPLAGPARPVDEAPEPAPTLADEAPAPEPTLDPDPPPPAALAVEHAPRSPQRDVEPAPARRARPDRHAPSREETHAEATPADPEPPAPGYLDLLAIPPSVVTLRGRTLGRTPLFERELPAGRHVLTLRPVEGGPDESVVVSIRPGETTHQRVRLDGY